MQVEIIMPKMGESIQEGTILRWAKKIGEKIEKDETLLEISTDKVDSEIPSPVQGILNRILVNEQETVPVGTIIAYIETEMAEGIHAQHTLQKTPEVQESTIDTILQQQPQVSFSGREQRLHAKRFYSPLVRTIAHREKVDLQELENIQGSGFQGRISKKDVLAFLQSRKRGGRTTPTNHRDGTLHSVDIDELKKKYPAPKYNLLKLDSRQKKMAEHMVMSVAVSPQVTVVEEVDVTEIVNFRLLILEKFVQQHGLKLTYLPFLAQAIVSSLKEFPILNGSLEGDVLIQKNFVHLGIAVASPNGLIVPVVHNAGEKNFLELVQSITDITTRARSNELTPEDVSDGTFSITNYGIFGSIIGTPIIHQPQLGIIGIGAIKKRPVVVTDTQGIDAIKIRDMVYLTLTFDHRVIDGALGGQFLARVKWKLENFAFQLENS